MNSAESFDSQGTIVNGVKIEFYEPNRVVLPIPENRVDAIATSIQFNLRIINSSPIPLPSNTYGMLFPELVKSDGQIIQRQEAIEQQESARQESIDSLRQPWQTGGSIARLFSNFRLWLKLRMKGIDVQEILASRERSRSVRLNASLFWLHDQLVLQFEFYRSDFFAALQPGKYYLRFLWGNSDRNNPVLVPEATEENRRDIKPQFASLQLVEPTAPEYKAVEVDDIRFETLVPEPEIAVGPPKSGGETPVRFGFHITNNTSRAIRFSLYASLIPKLVDPNGQEFSEVYFRRIEVIPKESDFPLLMPSESVTYFPRATLVRENENQLTLKIEAGDGGFWLFEELQLGHYQIQFTYRNKTAIEEIWKSSEKSLKQLTNIWLGLVQTPYRLVRLY